MSTCIEEKSVERDHIYCPTCKRDYAIYKILHICNLILPCTLGGRRRYTEEYIDKGQTSDVAPLSIECNVCAEERAMKTKPQHNKCPKCAYVGWYVSNETKLCPACSVTPVEKPKREPKPATTVVQQAPKPVLTLYTEIKLSTRSLYGDQYNAPDPHNAICTQIMINGVYISDVMTGDWVPVRWYHEFTGGTRELYYQDTMRELNEFLVKTREKYSIQWNFGSETLTKTWIWYLFNKFGPEGKTDLGFSI